MNTKYQIIYADPPWDLKMGQSRTGKNPKGNWKGYNDIKQVPYQTLSLDEIKTLKVEDISEKNSVLFLWTINKYLEDAYSVARCWGFKPSTLLVWCKKPMGLGMGGTFVQTTEYLLLARKGSLKAKKRIDSTWFEGKRGRHSKKPDAIRKTIEELFEGEKIELFARQKTEGWDVWGNEVESDIILTPKT